MKTFPNVGEMLQHHDLLAGPLVVTLSLSVMVHFIHTSVRWAAFHTKVNI